ncbi:MAG: type VI secretion system contractile sheath large subunit [Rubrivivax sp.]
MAPARLQFDMTFRPAGPARRREDAPMRLLLLADLGGDRAVPLRHRKPLAVDIDNFDAVLARVAPRLTLALDGQRLDIGFASLEDFHPDRLFARLPVFDALRRMRDEARDPSQFRRVAAALGIAPAAAPAPAAPAAAADAADDIQRLLGRAPSAPAAAAPAAPAGGTAALLDRWLHDLVAPHTRPDTAHEQRALVDAIDAALATLMRRVLHDGAFRALESAWLGADRLVRGLELGDTLHLSVLDVSRAELMDDLVTHRADLGGSALHALLRPAGGVEVFPWSLVALDHAFGPGPDDVQALAALGALGARAGAPLLAGGEPALAGAADTAALAEPRRWLAADDEALAFWQALRGAPMARWIGVVLPRVLMRLPYGAGVDPISAFTFEEMPAHAPAGYCWGGGAPALALLAGQAFQQGGWPLELGGARDLDDLPSHVYTEDGARHQQPCAELLLSEEAGEALLQRGLMPLMSWRQRPAARLLRWQSVAEPPQALAGLAEPA